MLNAFHLYDDELIQLLEGHLSPCVSRNHRFLISRNYYFWSREHAHRRACYSRRVKVSETLPYTNVGYSREDGKHSMPLEQPNLVAIKGKLKKFSHQR